MLVDPDNKLDAFVSKLNKMPFQESVSVFFVQAKNEDDLYYGTIIYQMDLDGYLENTSISSVTLRNDIIYALVKVSLKLGIFILVAHTHPPIDLFPKECGVYDNKGFSKQDLLFNVCSSTSRFCQPVE